MSDELRDEAQAWGRGRASAYERMKGICQRRQIGLSLCISSNVRSRTTAQQQKEQSSIVAPPEVWHCVNLRHRLHCGVCKSGCTRKSSLNACGLLLVVVTQSRVGSFKSGDLLCKMLFAQTFTCRRAYCGLVTYSQWETVLQNHPEIVWVYYSPPENQLLNSSDKIEP